MDCSGRMAVDAGGAAVGGRGACAWIRLAGAGGGSGARRCLGAPVAWCAADGGWKVRMPIRAWGGWRVYTSAQNDWSAEMLVAGCEGVGNGLG